MTADEDATACYGSRDWAEHYTVLFNENSYLYIPFLLLSTAR